MLTRYVVTSTTSFSRCTGAPQYVANILDHGFRLLANIEMRRAQFVDFGSGDGVVGAARAGAGHKEEISGALDMRILSARLRLSGNQLCFRLSPWFAASAIRAGCKIVQLRIEIQRMHSAFASDAGQSDAAERRPQIAQEPAIHPRDAHVHLLGHAVPALQIRWSKSKPPGRTSCRSPCSSLLLPCQTA